MLSNLRTRLLASYIFLLITSLAVLTGALLLFLSSRPAPAQLTWQRLEVMLPGLNAQEFTCEFCPPNSAALRPEMVLGDFAETNDVRVLVLAGDGERMFTVFDSTEEYEPRQVVPLQYQLYPASRVRPRGANREIIFGNFPNPDDTEWLFAGIQWQPERPRLRGTAVASVALLLAEPRPTQSLQAVLGEFGGAFLMPLAQAGLVGGVIAFVLAFVISRSIAQPLQRLARAAVAVARGHYSEHVPERGPTEVRSVAAAFNRMSADVRAAQLSQREFMANVSHDLMTPLTSIQGYSQAIIEGAAKDPAQAAEIIHDEAERLSRMVTELTDLARLQSGRLSMKSDAIDLSELVEAIAYRLGVMARQKQIRLHVETDPTPTIAGDGDRLVQVFTNLIGNAVKYTPDGGQVWVKTWLRDGGVEVTVRDTGIGIPAQDLPRIFERFYQVDKARGPQRGTGLGLAITKEIVTAHGGTIRIDSPGENQGTTVTVWLPSPQLSTIASRRPM